MANLAVERARKLLHLLRRGETGLALRFARGWAAALSRRRAPPDLPEQLHLPLVLRAR